MYIQCRQRLLTLEGIQSPSAFGFLGVLRLRILNNYSVDGVRVICQFSRQLEVGLFLVSRLSPFRGGFPLHFHLLRASLLFVLVVASPAGVVSSVPTSAPLVAFPVPGMTVLPPRRRSLVLPLLILLLLVPPGVLAPAASVVPVPTPLRPVAVRLVAPVASVFSVIFIRVPSLRGVTRTPI